MPCVNVGSTDHFQHQGRCETAFDSVCQIIPLCFKQHTRCFTRFGTFRQYVFGASASRIALLWYFTFNKDNFVGLETHPTFCLCTCLYVGAQVLVLFLQGMHGGRFLVPKALQPPKYDYHRPVPRAILDNTPECVICMLPLTDPSPYARDAPPASGSAADAPQQLEAGQALDPAHYMLTPCNHLFHTECLAQWMDEKMECPTCRGALPVP